jgi:protein-tyrosine phosphatase
MFKSLFSCDRFLRTIFSIIHASKSTKKRALISAHKVLVFCNAGVGRSPSVVVAYLCCKLGYGFGQAVEHVARRKPYMSILSNLILRIEELRKQSSAKKL